MGLVQFVAEKGDFEHAGVPVNVVRITSNSSDFVAYAYHCGLSEDQDRSPTAYGRIRAGHPNKQGSERLANAAAPWQNFAAGGVFRWAGVVSASKKFAQTHGLSIDDSPDLMATGVNKKGNTSALLAAGETATVGAYPVLQVAGDPSPGHYVSPNNTRLGAFPVWNQRRYADAKAVPFAVCGKKAWGKKKLSLGDFGLALNFGAGAAAGVGCSFVFGDSNASSHVGEISTYLMKQIRQTGSGKALFLAFPGTAIGVQGYTAAAMDKAVQDQFGKLKGTSNLLDLIDLLSVNANLTRFAKLPRESLLTETEWNRRLQASARTAQTLVAAGLDMSYVAPLGDFNVTHQSGQRVA